MISCVSCTGGRQQRRDREEVDARDGGVFGDLSGQKIVAGGPGARIQNFCLN